LLATPSTVCLVVLGKHIDGLNFINIILGDEPPLLPEERFYQRLLAGDATDAADQAEPELETQSLSAYYDAIPMKALVLAQTDAAEGKLTSEKQKDIKTTMDEIVENLMDYPDAEKTTIVDHEKIDADAATSVGQTAWRVLCVASRSSLDEAACAMLTHILEKRAIAAVTQPAETASTASGLRDPHAHMVCLSYFGIASKPAHVRYQIRRLKRVLPRARYLACFWMLEEGASKVEDWKASVGADFVATSLSQAAEICVREIHASNVPNVHILRPLETA
jgi:hypothetical protein